MNEEHETALHDHCSSFIGISTVLPVCIEERRIPQKVWGARKRSGERIVSAPIGDAVQRTKDVITKACCESYFAGPYCPYSTSRVSTCREFAGPITFTSKPQSTGRLAVVSAYSGTGWALLVI